MLAAIICPNETVIDIVARRASRTLTSIFRLRPRLHRYGSLVDPYHSWCGSVASTLLLITFAADRLSVYTSTDSERIRGLYIANEARDLSLVTFFLIYSTHSSASTTLLIKLSHHIPTLPGFSFSTKFSIICIFVGYAQYCDQPVVATVLVRVGRVKHSKLRKIS